MLADFFTKPLQGHLFRKFKAVLLGHAHIDTLILNPMAPVEERVEKDRFETHGDRTTDMAGTETVRGCTVVEIPKVFWADVVRKPAAVIKNPAVASNARKIPAIPRNGFVGNVVLIVTMS
jgi:hypothetical protein